MSERIKVLQLQAGNTSSTVEPVLRLALRLLNYSQAEFQFDFRKSPLQLRPTSPGEAYSWTELQTALANEQTKLKAKFLIGVLDQPIENNWFGRAIPGKNVIFITTWAWEYISDIPAPAFLAYEIIENLVELLVMRDASEQEWFFENIVHSKETRGCLSDLCVVKPQIALKIRTGDICADCLTVLKQRLLSATVTAVISMLDAVRQVALGRMEIPVLTEDAMRRQVDQEYPFPIAYCLRVMASEQTYTRKWLLFYDLYKLIVKYLTFCLLADRQTNRLTDSTSVDLSRLAFAHDGQWGWMAFKLAEELQSAKGKFFFSRFAKSFDREDLEAARLASRSIVNTRNDQVQGHGFTPPEPVCQEFFERHFADLKTLLNFIKPLANYKLVSPAGAVQPHDADAKWRWTGKYMMGSNPAFEMRQQITKDHPSDHCVLVKDNGDSLSLHPWLRLDYCPACFREMVFLYDKLDFEEAVHREYPTNHNQKSRDLGKEVRRQLGI